MCASLLTLCVSKDLLWHEKRGWWLKVGSIACRRLYIPCRTEFVWKNTVTDSILGEYMVDEKTSIFLTYCHLIRSLTRCQKRQCLHANKSDNTEYLVYRATCGGMLGLHGFKGNVQNKLSERAFLCSSVCWAETADNKPTAHSSCSFALLWVVCLSTLLIPRGFCCCCYWPIGSWDSFFFSKGREQMKWWDSCNFWMTPSWQRQSSSIVPQSLFAAFMPWGFL